MNKIISTLLKVLRTTLIPYNKIYNYLQLISNNVYFDKPISINGKIHIYNKGEIFIGSNCTFNSDIRSNFVGIKKDCTIGVKKGAKIKIGMNCGFTGVSIFASNEIVIGDNVLVGGNVSIWDTDFHSIDYMDRNINVNTRPIVIHNNVFIGAESIILKGVEIGERSIIGAGSVVTKSIGNGEIWAGNPAKFIRNI
jgi:acetyltransferase-like isoleucine patch superfamily enzyme